MIPTAGRVMEQISKENKNEEVNYISGADPGFFLGWSALVSCSTSTPINHIVFFSFFFGRIPVVLENRRSSQGGGVRTPCTLPLDPPLYFPIFPFATQTFNRGFKRKMNADTRWTLHIRDSDLHFVVSLWCREVL